MLYLLQCARLRVDDEAADGDIFGYERVGLDGLDGLADGGRGVLEPLQPVVQVDAALADGVEGFVRHAAGDHLVVEVVVAHVARPAVAVRHHHDLLHAQLVDGDNEAAHRRVEGRNHEAAGVLDDLRVAVFQSERGGQQLRQPRVHARQHCQLLVGVLVGEVFLVVFLFYERLVESDNLVDHSMFK